MENILERIDAGAVLLSDGAMGTLLFARGIDPGSAPETVNFSRPEILEEIAAEYLAAGSDILQTNTFGASPLKLAAYGLESRTDEINRRAVAAVRRVAAGRAYVAASCGPSGKLLEPYGDADPDTVLAGFERQMRILIEEGADLICIETMTDLAEATLAVRAARSVSATIPVMITMTFDATPRGFRTIMGTTVEQAARELVREGADIVGSNCGNGIERMIEVARAFRAVYPGRLAIQSNAGLPEREGDRIVYRESPEFMAEKARALAELPVAILGGCCGTTPAHIAALRRMLDSSR